MHVPAEAHGKGELACVQLQVVCRLVRGGQIAPWSRERHPRQAVMESRREQLERVPAVPPGLADPISGVEDHEVAVLSCQEAAHCETSLSSADNGGVEVVFGRLVCHGFSPGNL